MCVILLQQDRAAFSDIWAQDKSGAYSTQQRSQVFQLGIKDVSQEKREEKHYYKILTACDVSPIAVVLIFKMSSLKEEVTKTIR